MVEAGGAAEVERGEAAVAVVAVAVAVGSVPSRKVTEVFSVGTVVVALTHRSSEMIISAFCWRLSITRLRMTGEGEAVEAGEAGGGGGGERGEWETGKERRGEGRGVRGGGRGEERVGERGEERREQDRADQVRSGQGGEGTVVDGEV